MILLFTKLPGDDILAIFPNLYPQILEGIKNSVVEYDVEDNSCEKSKNELSFRFHNSNGQKRFCGHEPREKQVFVCNQTDH